MIGAGIRRKSGTVLAGRLCKIADISAPYNGIQVKLSPLQILGVGRFRLKSRRSIRPKQALSLVKEKWNCREDSKRKIVINICVGRICSYFNFATLSLKKEKEKKLNCSHDFGDLRPPLRSPPAAGLEQG